MPLDTCISNVGEYYSSHYLETTFANDLADLSKKWREQGAESPPRRLQRLSQVYFQAKGQALDEVRVEQRWQAGDDLAGWHARLLDALGYTDRQPLALPVEGGHAFAPCLARLNRHNRPWLVICETVFCLPDGSLKEGMPSEDPLSMLPRPQQWVGTEAASGKMCEGEWSRVVGRIFTDEDAPRWLLFLAGSQLLLLDRHTYSQGRYLAFDLDDAFGRKEKGVFEHLAAFLSAETLCPGGESDEVLLDRLEEQSHRFAHGVTDKLQFAVRESIELLVNEWVSDRRLKQWSYTRRRPDEIKPGQQPEITPEELTREALVFVYRLLFCFYAEARGGEMELLPIDDDVYRLGYSLESIRDLEQVPLTPATEAGVYFQEHLRKLFGLIHHGFQPQLQEAGDSALFGEPISTFSIRPLTATLFSPDATPLLDRAKLTNGCLQQIILRLSLGADERSGTIGRLNYAQLGINQLGAVYEGLLSYKGMFADEDLIHVKPASGAFFSQARRQGGKWSEAKKTPTWFVPVERLEEFQTDEVERIETGAPRIYKKGEFVMHLSGIDREQSASYYTPEVLTRCLVEEALRELLKDYTQEDADRILGLKICEPAMGSGAFLNEATSQLAHRYLELKQKQLGQSIEPAYYADEHRRVMHYIATRNVYGVDLNAMAVELGALSLWLGSIHRLLFAKGENGGRDLFQSGATPWFGLRLRCGNSLIGGRRAVWTTDQ
jgi:hypothetical protein